MPLVLKVGSSQQVKSRLHFIPLSLTLSCKTWFQWKNRKQSFIPFDCNWSCRTWFHWKDRKQSFIKWRPTFQKLLKAFYTSVAVAVVATVMLNSFCVTGLFLYTITMMDQFSVRKVCRVIRTRLPSQGQTLSKEKTRLLDTKDRRNT